MVLVFRSLLQSLVMITARQSSFLQIHIIQLRHCVFLRVRLSLCSQLCPSLVLGVVSLELPLAKQGVNLAVSKHFDLLIGERALHPIWVVPEILIRGQVVF